MSALEELRELVESEMASHRTTGGRVRHEAWSVLGALAVAEELAAIRALLEETAPRAGLGAGRRWAVWGR